MVTTVTLTANYLEIRLDGVLKNSIKYDNIENISPITQIIRQMGGTAAMVGAGTPTYTTHLTQWKVKLHLVDGSNELINLGSVGGQATWTNNAAGYALAAAAIEAAG